MISIIGMITVLSIVQWMAFSTKPQNIKGRPFRGTFVAWPGNLFICWDSHGMPGGNMTKGPKTLVISICLNSFGTCWIDQFHPKDRCKKSQTNPHFSPGFIKVETLRRSWGSRGTRLLASHTLAPGSTKAEKFQAFDFQADHTLMFWWSLNLKQIWKDDRFC